MGNLHWWAGEARVHACTPHVNINKSGGNPATATTCAEKECANGAWVLDDPLDLRRDSRPFL